MQQGFVNFMYLGRAMIHEDGFGSDPAFQAGGESLIDNARLFYDGNSQGGIMGGAYTALSVDSNRSVLGVPGMNYSTLLSRSVDFEPYAEGQFGETIEGVLCDQLNGLDPGQLPDEFPQEFKDALLEVRTQVVEACVLGIPDDTELGLYDNYPNQLERPLIFSLIQMVWDRGEANGYAHHMTTDPLAGTPAHRVLLHPAFGDHQVANLAAEVEARTIGASVYEPALDPGRHWQAQPVLPDPGRSRRCPSRARPSSTGTVARTEFTGTRGPGTATPPNENIPPRPPEFGADPHSYPRNDVKARAQKSEFLKVGGLVENFCTSDSLLGPPVLTGTATPCYSNGWTGP